MFECRAPDGKKLKPKFGDVEGILYTDLPNRRDDCILTVDSFIAECGMNTGFMSNTEDREYAGCLPIFEQQAKLCAAHFRNERLKCNAGGTDAATPEAGEAAGGDRPAETGAPRDEALTREQRIRVQRGLAALGFEAGPADGMFGPRTRSAIREWQQDKGLEATGYLTADQTEALAAAGAATPEAGEAAVAGDVPGPLCSDVAEGTACWNEVSNRPGCYIQLSYSSDLSWSGECVDGKASGRGRVEFPNGEVAEGQVSAGKWEGRWVVRYPDGDVAEGPYVAGKAEGRWVIREADGDVAEGQASAGKPVGRWVVRFADGDVGEGGYDEAWRQHGLWSYRRPDGSTYERRFRNGEIVSAGDVPRPLCSDVAEDWYPRRCWSEVGNRPGCYLLDYAEYLPSSWSGECVDGKASGRGRLEFPDGQVSEGQMSAGKREGRWVKRLAGDVFEGPYVAGKKEGWWVWTHRGKVWKSRYVAGELVEERGP